MEVNKITTQLGKISSFIENYNFTINKINFGGLTEEKKKEMAVVADSYLVSIKSSVKALNMFVNGEILDAEIPAENASIG